MQDKIKQTLRDATAAAVKAFVPAYVEHVRDNNFDHEFANPTPEEIIERKRLLLKKAFEESAIRLADAQKEHEAISEEVSKFLGHNFEWESRSLTYKFGSERWVVRNSWNYPIKKDLYEEYKDLIPEGLDPVIKKKVTEIKYKIDVNIYQRLDEYVKSLIGSKHQKKRDILLALFDKSKGKTSVTLATKP